MSFTSSPSALTNTTARTSSSTIGTSRSSPDSPLQTRTTGSRRHAIYGAPSGIYDPESDLTIPDNTGVSDLNVLLPNTKRRAKRAVYAPPLIVSDDQYEYGYDDDSYPDASIDDAQAGLYGSTSSINTGNGPYPASLVTGATDFSSRRANTTSRWSLTSSDYDSGDDSVDKTYTPGCSESESGSEGKVESASMRCSATPSVTSGDTRTLAQTTSSPSALPNRVDPTANTDPDTGYKYPRSKAPIPEEGADRKVTELSRGMRYRLNHPVPMPVQSSGAQSAQSAQGRLAKWAFGRGTHSAGTGRDDSWITSDYPLVAPVV